MEQNSPDARQQFVILDTHEQSFHNIYIKGCCYRHIGKWHASPVGGSSPCTLIEELESELQRPLKRRALLFHCELRWFGRTRTKRTKTTPTPPLTLVDRCAVSYKRLATVGQDIVLTWTRLPGACGQIFCFEPTLCTVGALVPELFSVQTSPGVMLGACHGNSWISRQARSHKHALRPKEYAPGGTNMSDHW